MLSAAFASPELRDIIALSLWVSLSSTAVAAALGLLFTPGAMILAQTVLALPIVIALSHRAAEGLWREFGEPLMDLGATKGRSVAALLAMGRFGMLPRCWPVSAGPCRRSARSR